MLNNIHLVASHVLMHTMSSFVISSRGRLVKFDVILMLFIGSLVCVCSPMSAVDTA